jgi:hypothetical protein
MYKTVPKTEVIFYKDEDGECPVLKCLDAWPAKVVDKCYARIELLEQFGHELRRPLSDTLRDGIHELRVKHVKVNYRILYFFNDKSADEKVAILSAGLTKEDVVVPKEIDKAIEAQKKFVGNPKKHTYEIEEDEGEEEN